MIKNYLKIGLRNLWKNKSFSAINIIGLATGLAVFLLIVLYVVDELSYDKYNVNADRIYRINSDIYFNNTEFISSVSPEPLASTLRKDFPQVEEIARLTNPGDILIKKCDENIQDHHAVFADSTFFKVFTIPMISGDPATALKEPRSIVIDETAAKRYFNSTNVVGKTLFIDNSTSCKITGVIKDIPRQSHFHFSFIRPLIDTYRGNADYWLSNNTYSYILLKPGVSQQLMQTHVDATIRNYLGKQLEAELHSSLKDIEQHGNYFRYTLMPLTDLHLHSDKSYDIEATGDARYVYIFSVIAILVLLIACINFMNLSTARSSNRAKEVGIRKVAGSLRGQLIVQFLVESVLISFFALVLALVICISLLSLFNQISGKEIHMGALFSSWLLPFVIALAFVVGCVAGSYPAFYLSSFEPIHVLKGAIASGFRKSSLRSMLVIFQFSISITLIIGTIVIYNQLNYIHNRRIGYDRYQVLVLHNTHPMDKQIKVFREEIFKIPGVNNATSSNDLPTASGFDQSAWFREANLDAGKAVITTNFYVDETYIPTLGIEMLKGRNFSPDYPTDSTAVIINEQAVKIFGFKDPMTGTMYSPGAKNNPVQYRVIGVVKDFNFSSMRNKVGPLVFRLYNNPGTIAVRIQSNNIPVLINAIENKWNSMAPGQPFQYTFMDADFDKMYHAEQRMGRLFISFAVFAIFIACLGLLGLVTYAAEQRTKEIGIRKVLGAGVGSIITMLSKDFAKLVLIASVIAFPFAWWIMNKWLQDFAYRINISWWVFLLAGLAAILIALITVSFQAIKAAVMNPVKSLRTE